MQLHRSDNLTGRLPYSAAVLLPAFGCLAAIALLAAPLWAVERDEHGYVVHRLESPRQGAATQVKVLLPDELKPGEQVRCVYLLPVVAGIDRRWGDGPGEVKRLDLHNRHRVAVAFPTFAQLPWYADHPSDAAIRQESYLLEDVIPLVEREHPVQAQQAGRLLVGFSKSGWGAWTLLLRHPETFSKAAAWDAPLAKTEPNQFGMGPIFGTQENFEKYEVLPLLKRQAAALGNEPRLGLLGYATFRQHHEQTRERLNELKIPHAWAEGPKRAHAWNSGWLPEAFEFVAGKPAAGP